MVFAFLCAVIVIPALAFYMIFSFRKKYYEWKNKTDPMEDFKDADIANYALEVRNLPIDEGVESL